MATVHVAAVPARRHAYAAALRTVAPYAGVLVLALQVAFLAWAWQRPVLVAVDAVQYPTMADRVRDGLPLYSPWPGYGVHLTLRQGFLVPPEHSPYPPFVGPALSLLPRVPVVAWIRVWWLVLLAAFWAYAAILSRLRTGRVRPRTVLSAGLLVMLTPGAWHGVALGNIDPLLWVAFGAAFLWPAVQGAAFALLALVKTYGVWPLAVALRSQGRKAATAAALTAVLAVGVSVAAMGAEPFIRACLDWFRYVPGYAAQGSFEMWNVSLPFLGFRLAYAAGLWSPTGPLPPAASLALSLAGVLAPALAWRATWRRSVAAQCGAVMAAAIFFSPIGWANYLPALWAPLAARRMRSSPPTVPHSGARTHG